MSKQVADYQNGCQCYQWQHNECYGKSCQFAFITPIQIIAGVWWGTRREITFINVLFTAVSSPTSSANTSIVVKEVRSPESIMTWIALLTCNWNRSTYQFKTIFLYIFSIHLGLVLSLIPKKMNIHFIFA